VFMMCPSPPVVPVALTHPRPQFMITASTRVRVRCVHGMGYCGEIFSLTAEKRIGRRHRRSKNKRDPPPHPNSRQHCLISARVCFLFLILHHVLVVIVMASRVLFVFVVVVGRRKIEFFFPRFCF